MYGAMDPAIGDYEAASQLAAVSELRYGRRPVEIETAIIADDSSAARVLTQADAQPGRTSRAAIGVASWFVDSHDVRRYASAPAPHGLVASEGCLNREANESAPPVCATA